MDARTSTHPTDQSLSGFGLGKLDAGAAGAVGAHLEGCARCRERVAALSATVVPSPGAETRGLASASSLHASPPATTSYHGSGPLAWLGGKAPDHGLADHPDYEIKRELGRGGMGVVYLAHNKLMGRDEVLKVMGRHLGANPDLVDRFLREIRAVARLRHENIVTAYSAARLGESLVLAMEHVEGLDLSRMVRAKGPLPVALACHFAYQAALGLQHAHEEGLVHRDIKPGNLMLTRKGKKATVKVLDFGLAKVAREGSGDGGLTQEGQALGTPDFIAPEQITNAQAADIRADIYSLGATLYYLLTGRPPFKSGSIYVTFQAHISREPDPLDRVRPEVPPELAAVVARMMAKDPAHRFQTPAEVAEALKPFFQGGNAAFRRPEVEFSASGGFDDDPGPLPAPDAKATPGAHAELPATRIAGAVVPTKPEVRWESLIDFREGDEPEEPAPEPSGSIRPPAWFWPSIAAGVLASGFLAVLLAIGLRVKTDKGELVFDGLPDDAVVSVDGEVVEVEWPGGGGPAKASIPAGEHSVKVEFRGVEVAGDEVKLDAGGRKWIRVRLVPAVAGRQEKTPEVEEPPKPAEVAATPPTPPDMPADAPAQPPATDPPAAPLAPGVLYADTLDNPAGGWPQEDPNAPRKEGDSYHYGYGNGVWFSSGGGYAEWSQSIPYSAQSEFRLKVVGRVLDETPESRGRWTIHVLPKDPEHRGFQVAIERNGVISLDPSFWNKGPHPEDPRVGPMIARDFRAGTAFNAIELRVRNRQVEILCNGTPVGPPVSYDWDLTPCWIHAGVDGFKGSYRAEVDSVEVKKLDGEPGEPAAARTPNLLFSDAFDDPRTGWSQEEPKEPGALPRENGYRNGVYFVSRTEPGWLSFPCARDFGGDFQVDVSGRVLDAAPDALGFWAIHLLPRTPGARGLQVGIDRSGVLVLEPSSWTAEGAEADPRLGPITLRSFKRGNKFNTLTLRVRKRRVEILVNGSRIGPTLSYGWDLSPAALHLGLIVGAGNSRAEFDRIEVRELPPLPPADPKR